MTDWDFSDLKAIYINCTLKRSPAISHTQGLIDATYRALGCSSNASGAWV